MEIAMPAMRCLAAALLTSACWIHGAAAGTVWTVPGMAPNLQLAVNVASPGDVILVAPGTYTEVVQVDGKGIAIVADGNPALTASLATLEVRNIPAGQTFLLDGFLLDLPDVFLGPDIPFVAEDNLGSLRLQDCTFRGDPGYQGQGQLGAWPGTVAAQVRDSASVTFHHCTFEGGDGASLFDEDIDFTATDGGHGLQVISSTVDLHDSFARGGVAGSFYDTVGSTGRSGGSAVHASGTSVVQVHGSTLIGGHGGAADCDFFGCGDGGPGGSGVLLAGTSHGSVRDNTYQPGTGGPAGGFGALDGSDGQAVLVSTPGGTLAEFSATYRGFDVPSPVREGAAAVLTFTGEPGDSLLLFGSLASNHIALPGHQGSFLVGFPLLLSGITLGSIPAAGTMQLLVPITDLGAGIEALPLSLQPAFVDMNGAWLGPVEMPVLLDGSL